MSNKYAFLEKQYIGRDCIRLLMAAFCFGAYVYERDRDNTQDLFLVVGFGIIGISIILLFMIQYKIIIHNKSMIIDGLWTAKKVKIDLNSIVNVRKDTYSNYLFNNPVYNLHRKGSIRFGERCRGAYRQGRTGILYWNAASKRVVSGDTGRNEATILIPY
jgi:hypothetical protein